MMNVEFGKVTLVHKGKEVGTARLSGNAEDGVFGCHTAGVANLALSISRFTTMPDAYTTNLITSYENQIKKLETLHKTIRDTLIANKVPPDIIYAISSYSSIPPVIENFRIQIKKLKSAGQLLGLREIEVSTNQLSLITKEEKFKIAADIWSTSPYASRGMVISGDQLDQSRVYLCTSTLFEYMHEQGMGTLVRPFVGRNPKYEITNPVCVMVWVPKPYDECMFKDKYYPEGLEMFPKHRKSPFTIKGISFHNIRQDLISEKEA